MVNNNIVSIYNSKEFGNGVIDLQTNCEQYENITLQFPTNDQL